MLTDIVGSSFDGIFPKRCQEEFSVIKTGLDLAIQAYQTDHNAYPQTLDDLHPKYLDTVEKRFGGQEILYIPATGLVSLAQ